MELLGNSHAADQLTHLLKHSPLAHTIVDGSAHKLRSLFMH